MGFYQDRVVPHLVHLAMRNRRLLPYRERVIAAAQGRVLEIGIGSGLNLPFYSPQVGQILGLEPAPRLLRMARDAAMKTNLQVSFIEGSAEAIPLEDGSIDTVVTTWTLCTIPAVAQALGEMRRVLRPGGELLFVEHGLAPDASVRNWQDWLTPAWKRISGGCHLNRPIRALIEQAGFGIKQLEATYMKGGLKPMVYLRRPRQAQLASQKIPRWIADIRGGIQGLLAVGFHTLREWLGQSLRLVAISPFGGQVAGVSVYE